MKKKQKKTKKRAKTGDRSFLKTYLTAEIKGLSVYTILLLLSSLVCYKIDASKGLYFPIMLSVCIIAGFLCGVFVASKVNIKGIFCGLIGAVPVAVASVTAALTLGEFNIGAKLIVTFFATLAAGIVGGVLTANARR